MEKRELLKPKLDIVFHALFREENKHLLGALISAVLGEKVNVVTTDKNRYIETQKADEKLGIMDMRAELEGGVQCNIEVQLYPHEYENERILLYWADAYKRQILRGDGYGVLNKTISIVILDHEVGILKGIEELDVKWQIRDDKTGKRVLTDKLEIVIIELPKARRIYEQDRSNEIGQWMLFLDNPNDKEVDEIMAKNRDISKAIAELEQVSGEERLQRIAELREKAIRDEQATHEYFKNKGLREGREQGLVEGREEGIKQGIKEGRKQRNRTTEK